MIYIVNGKTNGFGNTIYIGRQNIRYGLEGSPLANPFVIGRDGNREEVIEKYRIWLKQKIETDSVILKEILRIHQLAKTGDVRLSCWCTPLACHGSIIKEVIDGLKR